MGIYIVHFDIFQERHVKKKIYIYIFEERNMYVEIKKKAKEARRKKLQKETEKEIQKERETDGKTDKQKESQRDKREIITNTNLNKSLKEDGSAGTKVNVIVGITEEIVEDRLQQG